MKVVFVLAVLAVLGYEAECVAQKFKVMINNYGVVGQQFQCQTSGSHCEAYLKICITHAGSQQCKQLNAFNTVQNNAVFQFQFPQNVFQQVYFNLPASLDVTTQLVVRPNQFSTIPVRQVFQLMQNQQHQMQSFMMNFVDRSITSQYGVTLNFEALKSTGSQFGQ